MVAAAAQGAPFATLHDAKFLSLTTYCGDSAPVATPVWHVCAGDRLYVRAPATSGKIKRLRREGRAMIAPCTAHGELRGALIAARTRVLPPDEAEVARRALHRRSGLVARLAELGYRLRGWQHAFIEISPVQPADAGRNTCALRQ